MGKQAINLGATPTGVGGDTPRSAFTKVNANFVELYAADAANYKRSNFLAPVSQSGGVPTGGAMEKISNATGFVYKYANGMQVTTQEVIGYTAQVGLRRNFPAAFFGVPAVSVSVLPTSNWDFSCQIYPWDGGFEFMSTSTFPQNKVFVMAIGRWF